MKRCLFFLSLAAFALNVHAENKVVNGDIVNNAGNKIGELRVEQGHKGIVINIQAKGLPPGYHGMHFHAVGDCSDAAEFKLSKGHINPYQLPHGFLNPKGPHEGNLPNLVVAGDGSVEVELYSTMLNLVEGETNLLDEDGSALIIHADKDDHTSQPIGGSGARIACAALH